MPQLQTVTYNSINDISLEVWTQLNTSSNIYFSPSFLKAFEVSNPRIDYKYIIISDQGKAVALALVQTIELNIDVILKNIKIANWLRKIINYFFCNSIIKIMFHGNIFLSGEYGLLINDKTDKKEVVGEIAKEINNIAKNTKHLHAIFVKDFLKESLPITNHFKNYGFTSMHVEPNLILELNSSWNSYDDYKAALKSKYRVKVNKADSTSSGLIARLFNEADFATYKDQLQQLYENTIANANFNAQVLNLNTYIHLRKLYQDDFIVKAYFKEEKLVGFLSALVNNNQLVAHFIGLDYELNKSQAIYPRILNDYVRIGIEKQVSHINFGRTASEIKTTIGAKPVNLTCYIKHKRPIINTIVRYFSKRVQLKEFNEHQPFKKEKEA